MGSSCNNYKLTSCQRNNNNKFRKVREDCGQESIGHSDVRQIGLKQMEKNPYKLERKH